MDRERTNVRRCTLHRSSCKQAGSRIPEIKQEENAQFLLSGFGVFQNCTYGNTAEVALLERRVAKVAFQTGTACPPTEPSALFASNPKHRAKVLRTRAVSVPGPTTLSAFAKHDH